MISTTKVLNVIYILTAMLFLLDSMASFDIKSQALKTFVYFGFLLGTPLTLVSNLLVIKAKTKRVIGAALPSIMLTLILVTDPMKILFSAGAWRTQTILYQNGYFKFKTVEFQMQDIGAMGYNKRTVEVCYWSPFFMTTNEVPTDIAEKVDWIKVNKGVNELGLKSP